ncbi:tetratricopeptide repeat protein [Methylomonas sp. MED-D]|uniref:tetratricopeptide repeat protein n=1 Tax=unclassified Methylomonas TaxID=2608980 RepID=UPI0028A3823E|nr:hypothetical protein [Methylomonas sp. MV1]MDT4331121.1 hypothetical protein [Methylomonas sp. MV1]
MKYLFLVLIVINSSGIARAEGYGVTTSTDLKAEGAKGSQFRARVLQLVSLVKSKHFDEAETFAAELRRTFESSFDRSLKQYVFQSNIEYQEFLKNSSESFEWIDWGYKECIQMQAFIASDKRLFSVAIDRLKELQSIAPMSADTSVELGFAFNQSHHPDDALAAYERGLQLARRYPSQRSFEGAALRGKGYSLVELGNLHEAELAYEESLMVEPGNKVALRELEYIRQSYAKQ